MSFCDFSPDAPECQAPVEEPAAASSWEDDSEPMKVGAFEGWEAQLAYTLTAAWGCTYAALDLWRYNKTTAAVLEEASYEAFFDGFNYYKVAHLIWNYSALSLWGWAFIIQLIANFGVLNGLNILTWTVILPLAFALVNLSAGLIFFLGYDKAYTDYEANGTTYYEGFKTDTLYKLAEYAGVTLELLANGEEWFMANYKRMPAAKTEKHEKKMNKEEKLAVISSLLSF